jgi:hypothetical protein
MVYSLSSRGGRTMERKEPDHQEPPYYTLDTLLFQGTFRYFDRGEHPVEVRGKIHINSEQYHLTKLDQQIEPIQTLRGVRHYYHLKPYILLPSVILTIGLYEEPNPDVSRESAIGEVLGAHEAGKREVEIGQAQAWWYPEDKTVVLWECLLHSFTQERPLLQDENMLHYWQGVERFFHAQCPDAERITTPFRDPEYEIEEYQQFLRVLGYQPVAKAAYGKEINPKTRSFQGEI